MNFSARLPRASKHPHPTQANRVADSVVKRQRTSLLSIHRWLVSAHARRFLSLPAGRHLSSVNRSSERLFNCCLNSRDRREWGGQGRQTCTAGIDNLTAQCSAAKNKQLTWTYWLWLAGSCVLSAIFRESNVRQTKTRTNI